MRLGPDDVYAQKSRGDILECHFEFKFGVFILHIAGELDLGSLKDLDRVLKLAVEHDSPVLVDLSRTQYIDSTGIKLLLDADRDCRQKGKPFLLYALSPQVRGISKIIDLDQYVPVFPTLQDALRSVYPPRDSSQ